MYGIVLLGCVGAGKLEDDFRAAGVFGNEASYIVDVAVEDDPAAFCGVVLCDCLMD